MLLRFPFLPDLKLSDVSDLPCESSNPYLEKPAPFPDLHAPAACEVQFLQIGTCIEDAKQPDLCKCAQRQLMSPYTHRTHS